MLCAALLKLLLWPGPQCARLLSSTGCGLQSLVVGRQTWYETAATAQCGLVSFTAGRGPCIGAVPEASYF